MRVVQSLRLSASPQAHDEACWRLSHHLLKRWFGVAALHFYGCARGTDYVRGLGLEYGSVSALPEIADSIPANIWSAGKLAAMADSCAHGPSMHVDHDVFFIKRPPGWLLDSGFFCQSEETDVGTRDRITRLGSGDLHSAPPGVNRDRQFSHNFGIWGGQRADAIKDACDTVLSWAAENAHLLRSLSVNSWALYLMEQCWVPQLIEARGVPITFLVRASHVREDTAKYGYVHAYGAAKRDRAKQIAAFARRHMGGGA